MRCESCGAELPDGTRYCTNCGAEVLPDDAQELAGEQQPDYNQQYTYIPQQQQQQYHPQPVMDPPLSVGQYVGMFLLMLIPIVNLILLLVWGFGSTNQNRKNFARAALIMALIGIFITIILALLFMYVIPWDVDFFWMHGRWW